MGERRELLFPFTVCPVDTGFLCHKVSVGHCEFQRHRTESSRVRFYAEWAQIKQEVL